MSDSRDPRMDEAMEDVGDLQYAAAASFFATEDAAARPGGEGTRTEHDRTWCLCPDCKAVQAECPHDAGVYYRSQFDHGGFSTWVGTFCKKCSCMLNIHEA